MTTGSVGGQLTRKEACILVRKVWIDARHPRSTAKLWGLTLLERNIRVLARLGVEEIVVVTLSEGSTAQHLKHTLPKAVVVRFETVENAGSFDSLAAYLQEARSLVLVLAGNVVHDTRILNLLANTGQVCGLLLWNNVSAAAVAILSAAEAALVKSLFKTGLTTSLQDCLEDGTLERLALGQVNPYIKHLRKTLSPLMIRVETEADLDTADVYLQHTVQKGTNDFVATYIHPPLEFGLTRLLASTRMTPNHVTFVGMILSSLALYWFATGYLGAGIVCAAIKGVLDGVDGKLARLHIKYSTFGDLLDHVGDIIFDALWYLALGWHFSKGDLSSTAALFTSMLFTSYWVQRIVPGVFERRQGCEIYDYMPLDRCVRLIGSRMNNNVWLMMLGIVLGFARESFYMVSVWMCATAVWYTCRLMYVTWRALPHLSSRPQDKPM
jgi:phosphatidylglycerophosphate synthase